MDLTSDQQRILAPNAAVRKGQRHGQRLLIFDC